MSQIGHKMYVLTVFLVALCATAVSGMDIARVQELIDAVRYEKLARVQELIAGGVDINQPNKYNWVPLHEAAFGGYRAIVQTLIAAGANVNQQDIEGETPLNIAAHTGRNEVVLMLIAAGANVNQSNNRGETPLHWAVLHAHQADGMINRYFTRGEWGEADFYSCLKKQAVASIQALIAAGANVNQSNNRGETPLQLATQYRLHEIVNVMNRTLAAHAVAQRQSLTLWSAMHPRIGQTSPASLIHENQPGGIAHYIGQLVHQAALENAVYNQESETEALPSAPQPNQS